MRRWIRRAGAALASALLALTVSGCGFTFSPQELYSLPTLPPEYTELNDRISAILADGAENAPPVSGTNIQSVQLVDLDGDGQEEAVAFFRNSADEKPLKIYIFTAQNETYEQTALIEGSGTGIYSIVYSDLDQDGAVELLVGWRVSTDLQALSVYSLRGKEPRELMRTNYVKYAITDLDEDLMQELVVFRSDEEGGVADYYGWRERELALRSSARISSTMAELSGQQGRVQRGTLVDGVPALFATGVDEAGMSILDILIDRDGELGNIALSDATGVSGEITRFHALYPSDINGDGVTEVPRPVYLPAKDEEEEYQQVDWYDYAADGEAERVMSTYHDNEDGWYLLLPETWRDRVLIDRSTIPDEAAVTFFVRGTGGAQPGEILKIYTLTGSSREMKAIRGNRFILSRQSETIYAGELLEANESWEYGLTEDEVRTAFNRIAAEWLTGDN